jgi:hypothetical protein
MCTYFHLMVKAKFWLEPQIELALNKGLKTVELTELRRIVRTAE